MGSCTPPLLEGGNMCRQGRSLPVSVEEVGTTYALPTRGYAHQHKQRQQGEGGQAFNRDTKYPQVLMGCILG